MRKVSAAKAERLRGLATEDGIIAALAMDQRKSLRRLIAEAAGVPLEHVADEQLASFKEAVTEVLSPYASAILLDPEYGASAFLVRAPSCGLLATYECDGYENPRPHRMLALMAQLSAQRIVDLGASGIKILLSYNPFADAQSNDEKCAMIERIGGECEAAGIPFFLEPVGYDPDGTDPKSFAYAQRKPEIVIRSMEEFSKPRYRVDVLKVEFPVDATYIEESAVFGGQTAYTREQALEYFRLADAAAETPYIYLSAGVSNAQFTESLRLAAESGSRFSGVLCGRATWQAGVATFAGQGAEAFRRWLQQEGVRNIQAVNECLAAASPWHSWFANLQVAGK